MVKMKIHRLRGIRQKLLTDIGKIVCERCGYEHNNTKPRK